MALWQAKGKTMKLMVKTKIRKQIKNNSHNRKEIFACN